ncbi:hypothetical protein STEG23_029801, partial [Scotinomys teguina]
LHMKDSISSCIRFAGVGATKFMTQATRDSDTLQEEEDEEEEGKKKKEKEKKKEKKEKKKEKKEKH